MHGQGGRVGILESSVGWGYILSKQDLSIFIKPKIVDFSSLFFLFSLVTRLSMLSFGELALWDMTEVWLL